jgi:general secretion pathway protein B
VSFILDALKKSEGERQRQSGPAMFEVRVAPPRARMPLWAGIVGGLLLINLAIVAWLVTRTPGKTDAIAATAQPTQPASAAASSPPLATRQPEPVPVAPALPDEATTAATEPIEPIEPIEPVDEAATEEPLLADAAPEPRLDAPVALDTPRPRSRVTRGTGLGIPTYDQLGGQAGAGIPELRLDLHVYAERPADRFVFVNNRRLREGEALPDGTRVESIVPDGVVLSARNQRFLLQRD